METIKPQIKVLETQILEQEKVITESKAKISEAAKDIVELNAENSEVTKEIKKEERVVKMTNKEK